MDLNLQLVDFELRAFEFQLVTGTSQFVTHVLPYHVPMWADVLHYYETIQLDKIHCKRYLL